MLKLASVRAGKVVTSAGIGFVSLAQWLSATGDETILRRLLIGAKWSLLGEVGTRALSFIAAAIMARLLGITEYGGYAFIQGCLATFMAFAAFGLGQTTGRYVAALQNHDRNRIPALCGLALLFSIISGGIAVVLLLIFAPTFARDILGKANLSVPLQLAAPALLFSSIAGAFNGAIAGFEAFEKLAKQGWMTSVVTFVGVMIGVKVAGLSGAAIGLVLGEMTRMILAARGASAILQSQGLPMFSGTGLNEVTVLWKFALPTAISGALHVPVFWLCQSILASSENGLA